MMMAAILNAVRVDTRCWTGRETAFRSHPAAVIVDILQIEGMYMSREVTVICQNETAIVHFPVTFTGDGLP